MFKKHGVPRKFICDRDPKLIFKFREGLKLISEVDLNMSTADHPEKDGQSEVTIKTISRILRPGNRRSPNQWSYILNFLELEYNYSRTESTCLSPVEVEIGVVLLTFNTRRYSIGEVTGQLAR